MIRVILAFTLLARAAAAAQEPTVYWSVDASGNAIAGTGALFSDAPGAPPPASLCDSAAPCGWVAASALTPQQKQQVAPPSPQLTPQQAAEALLAAGLAVTSTSTPGLNGTYGLAPSDQSALTAMQVAILSGVTPPTTYIDSMGSHGPFTPQQLTALAVAAFQYVAAVEQGQSPSQPVTIP